jgi:hypothetical protein
MSMQLSDQAGRDSMFLISIRGYLTPLLNLFGLFRCRSGTQYSSRSKQKPKMNTTSSYGQGIYIYIYWIHCSSEGVEEASVL